jgi:integrase/recombinase XerD
MPKKQPTYNEQLTVVTKQGAVEKFDLSRTFEFSERSISEETRRAYRRVVHEFFRFFDFRHPKEITSEHILAWRESLIKAKKKPATIALKLSVIRSLYDFLKSEGVVKKNPANTKRVPAPALTDDLRGRALDLDEVQRLLFAPNREKSEGARDHALMLLMLRTSIRVAEACSLKVSDIKWSHGRWIVHVKVKGRSERTIPLPNDVREAINTYLKLDRTRRELMHSDGAESFVFQPMTNYRTLKFDKPISTTMAWHIVQKWGKFSGIGKVSPHDLRRTAITRALDQGLSYQQVQMMSGHRDPKTVIRYDHHRNVLDRNAINFLSYEKEPTDKKE